MSPSTKALALAAVAGDGARLRVARTSGTGTTLVICNDFAANIEILAEFAARLDMPVVLFDYPGIGRSRPPQRMRRMPALARLFAGLLDGLGLDEPIDAMGIGWGGMLAQRFARDYPARLRRLLLAASSNGQVMFPGRLRSVWHAGRPRGLAASVDAPASARSLFGGRRNDECAAISRAMARALPPTRKGYAAQLYALAGFTSLGWLHRIDAPTLVIAGDDDPVVPMVNARVLAFLMPRARLQIVRGGGHWFVLERSEETAQLLAGFLQGEYSEKAPPDDTIL